MAAAIALLAGAPAVACGLTADFSGLQGGTRDAGSGDAGDANAEAQADAGEGGEGAAPDGGFCASLATPVRFCADFDEGAPVGAGWSSVDVWQGQSASVDFTYFTPPGSFLSSIDAASAPASARLQEDVPTDATRVHVEFEMLLPPYQGNFELCTLHEPVADGTTYGTFYKYENGNLLVFTRNLGADGGEVDAVDTIGPPPSSWLHVEIDVNVATSGSVVVKHDGQVVVNHPGVDTSTLTRASMFVELGYYSDAPATTLAHFDDVIVDWQ